MKKSKSTANQIFEYLLDPSGKHDPIMVDKSIGKPNKSFDRKYWIDREIQYSKELLYECFYEFPAEKLFGTWLFDQDGNPIVYDSEEIARFSRMKSILLRNISRKTYFDKSGFYERIVMNAISALVRPSKELLMENKNGYLGLYGQPEKIEEMVDFINSSKEWSKDNFAVSVHFDEDLYEYSGFSFWKELEKRTLENIEEKYNFYMSLDDSLLEDQLTIRETNNPKSPSRLFAICADHSTRLKLKNQSILLLIGGRLYSQDTRSYYKACQVIGGRRKLAESTVGCAKRKFTEETGIPIETLRNVGTALPYGNLGIIFMVEVDIVYEEFKRFMRKSLEENEDDRRRQRVVDQVTEGL
jgi:hypothetical protein